MGIGREQKNGTLRVALAQINPCVGDIAGNTLKILEYIGRSRAQNADVVVFPELAITGYPPEDLAIRESFLNANTGALARVIEASTGLTVVCGFIEADGGRYNAAAVIQDGKLQGVHRKTLLSQCGQFVESRHFTSGDDDSVFGVNGITLGISIGADIWNHSAENAQLLININASPYFAGKHNWLEEALSRRAEENSAFIVYVNAVGGQDELVFDGQSLVVDPEARTVARAKAFDEQLLIADIDFEKSSGQADIAEPMPRTAEVYSALVLGVRDYVRKNGFKRVGLGLSGGIDSALTATIARDALGAENVVGVLMPSVFTSFGTRTDAEILGRNLNIETMTLPIDDVFGCYRSALSSVFRELPEDTTEENLQARIRGNFLMALSNKFGWLVLTTGNKSETAVGYTTLYGDMAGGLAVLKDVPKTLVYELSSYRNSVSSVIPESTINRPPSAELRPNQLDQDSLPPYDVLDPILHHYIEENASVEEIVGKGYPEDVVRRVVQMVGLNEYKRRQAPPGIKISSRALGVDLRLPMTNSFRE